MLVSVIIPVYNGEKHLRECLESVKACPSTAMECIIIDDGSIDATNEISRRFVTEDARFRLICKENTGVSDSRNRGIVEAAGDYIFFLDADDYIDPSGWREIMDRAAAGGIDMIAYGYYDIFESGRVKKESFPKGCDIKYALLATTLLNTCWGKLLRREIIVSNGLGFRKELKTCEDTVFILDFAQKAKDFLFSDKCLVYYRIHAGGIMQNTVLESKISDLSALFDSRMDYLADNYDGASSKAMYRQFFSIITDLLRGSARNQRVSDLKRTYENCMTNPAIAAVMSGIRKDYLSPFYKRFEYALLCRGSYAWLGLYFKVKLRFSIERRR